MVDETKRVQVTMKEQGLRKKAITEADVRAKMIEQHPDEFRAADTSLRRFSLAVEHAEHAVKCVMQKSRSLQVEARGVTIGEDD